MADEELLTTSQLARALGLSLSSIKRYISAGQIKPVIHQVFPAAQAADAHRLMESSEHIGKIVLTW